MYQLWPIITFFSGFHIGVMSYQPKKTVNGSMVPGNGVTKATPSAGKIRVARQHSAAADDPRNYTAPHPEQMDWSIHNLPAILYQFRPVNAGAPDQRVGIKAGPNGNQLRDLPVLPDHISSNVEEWRVEAWMRLDKRIRLGDITERMHPEFRIPNNTLQQRGGRFRQDFHLISWYSGNRKSAEIEAKVTQKLIENGIDPALNSTRGLTPGLINPELGEAGGRVPLPANWSGLKIARAPRRKPPTPRATPGIRNTAPQNLTHTGDRSRVGSNVAQQAASTFPCIPTPVSKRSPVIRHDIVQQAGNNTQATAVSVVRRQGESNGMSPFIGGVDGAVGKEQAIALTANRMMLPHNLRVRDKPASQVVSEQPGEHVNHSVETNASGPFIGSTDGSISSEHATTLTATGVVLPPTLRGGDEQASQEATQQPEGDINRHASPENDELTDLPSPQSSIKAIETPKNEEVRMIDFDAEDIPRVRMSLDVLQNLDNLSHIPLPGNLHDVDIDYMGKHAAIRQFASEPNAFSHGIREPFLNDFSSQAKESSIHQFKEELRAHKALAPRDDEPVYSVQGGISLEKIANDTPLDVYPFEVPANDPIDDPFNALDFFTASFTSVDSFFDDVMEDVLSSSSASSGLTFSSAGDPDFDVEMGLDEGIDLAGWLSAIDYGKK